MSGIEYLNLQTHTDFMRLCRDLRKQAKQLPLEQTVMIFLMYRPEIAAFTARQKTRKSRMLQLHLDMDMTELMLRYDEPGTRLAVVEECRKILMESLEFLREFLEDANDYKLWALYGVCCHRLVACCVELKHQAQAEQYCVLFHHACRQISRLCSGRITLDEHLKLLIEMYDDTNQIFSDSRDAEKRIRGYRARMRRERVELWWLRLKEQDRFRTMVRSFLAAASDLTENPTPRTLELAMELCIKARDIISNNLNLWGMRTDLIKCWITMGYIWELYENEKGYLKARECYFRAAEASRSYYRQCVRDQSGTYDAVDYLQRCYIYIAEMYEKFSGEKNARKAAKYRSLAEEQE